MGELPAGAPGWRKWHQNPGTRSRRIAIKGAPTRKVPSSCFHFLQSMFLVRDQQIRDQMQARSSPRPWTGGGASRGRLRQLPCNCATHRRNEGLPTSSPASLAKRVCSRCTGTRPCFSISVGARVGSGGEHEPLLINVGTPRGPTPTSSHSTAKAAPPMKPQQHEGEIDSITLKGMIVRRYG
jgi:hypothetical protein